MEHQITTSGDGSTTLQLSGFNETYHSRNGAYTEAQHIYILNGLEYMFSVLGENPQKEASIKDITIFDVGFGTGLNCILAYVWQQERIRQGLPFPRIFYCGIEKYPIPQSEIREFNYHKIIAENTDIPSHLIQEIFFCMHNCPWEEDVYISENFILKKNCADISDLTSAFFMNTGLNTKKNCAPPVIFYQTLTPATQPHLWDEKIFRAIASGCPTGATLVTYCCKGTVKQALRNAGFTLQRLGGPPGKRHIRRAIALPFCTII